jgi:hypothetical protein
MFFDRDISSNADTIVAVLLVCALLAVVALA